MKSKIQIIIASLLMLLNSSKDKAEVARHITEHVFNAISRIRPYLRLNNVHKITISTISDKANVKIGKKLPYPQTIISIYE